MKRVLVTGASGFVGANLARRLLVDGYEVHLLLRPGYEAWRIDEIADHCVIHLADLTDAEAVMRAFRIAAPEWVFHLAAYGAYPHQRDLSKALATNVAGLANIFDACKAHSVSTVINAGSSSEYGLMDHPPTELECVEPNSAYAISKVAATHLCRQVARTSKLEITTLRLYSVYGPFEEPKRFIPTLIVHGLEERLPPLVDPAVARDYVYVDDVVEAFLLAAGTPMEEPGAVFNIGTGRQVSIGETVETIREQLGIIDAPRWGSMENRSWDTDVWVSNPSKAFEQIGWAAGTSFEDGLEQMTRWLGERANFEFYRPRVNRA